MTNTLSWHICRTEGDAYNLELYFPAFTPKLSPPSLLFPRDPTSSITLVNKRSRTYKARIVKRGSCMDIKRMDAKKYMMRHGKRGEEKMSTFREGKRCARPITDLERSMKRVGEKQFMIRYLIMLGKGGVYNGIMKRKEGASNRTKKLSSRSWRRIV